MPNLGSPLTVTAPDPTQNQPTITPSAPAPMPQVTPEGVVNVASLNLRNGPSGNFKIIGSLHRDDSVTISQVSPDGGWLKVTTKQNQQGWVSSQFIDQRTSPAQPKPQPATPPAQAVMPAAPKPDLWFQVNTASDVAPAQAVTTNLDNLASYEVMQKHNLSDNQRTRQGLWIVISDSPSKEQVAATLSAVAISYAESPRFPGPQVVVVYAYKSAGEIGQAAPPSIGWALYAVDGRGWDGKQTVQHGTEIHLADNSYLIAIAPQ